MPPYITSRRLNPRRRNPVDDARVERAFQLVLNKAPAPLQQWIASKATLVKLALRKHLEKLEAAKPAPAPTDAFADFDKVGPITMTVGGRTYDADEVDVLLTFRDWNRTRKKRLRGAMDERADQIAKSPDERAFYPVIELRAGGKSGLIDRFAAPVSPFQLGDRVEFASWITVPDLGKRWHIWRPGQPYDGYTFGESYESRKDLIAVLQAQEEKRELEEANPWSKGDRALYKDKTVEVVSLGGTSDTVRVRSSAGAVKTVRADQLAPVPEAAEAEVVDVVEAVDPLPVQSRSDDEIMTERFFDAWTGPDPFTFVARWDGKDEPGSIGQADADGRKEVRIPMTVELDGRKTYGFQGVVQKGDKWVPGAFYPRAGVRITVPAGEAESDFSTDEAIEWVIEASTYLASFPAPSSKDNFIGDEGDGVGLNSSTNGPIRTYVAEVEAGLAEGDANKALAAAEYLRIHAANQLDKAGWTHAYNRLKRAATLDSDQAKTLIKGGGGNRVGATSGETKHGSYSWDASSGTLRITNTPRQRKVNMKSRALPDGVRWAKEDGEFVLKVDVSAIPEFTQYVEDAYPTLVSAIRANEAAWAEEGASEEGDDPAPDVSADAAAGVHVFSYRSEPVRVSWDPSEPEVFEESGKNYYLGQILRSPKYNARRTDMFRGEQSTYANLVPVASLPLLIESLRSMAAPGTSMDKKNNELADWLSGLYEQWSAVEVDTGGIDLEKAAEGLFRRFKPFLNPCVLYECELREMTYQAGRGRSTARAQVPKIGPDGRPIPDLAEQRAYVERLMPAMPVLVQLPDGLPDANNPDLAERIIPLGGDEGRIYRVRVPAVDGSLAIYLRGRVASDGSFVIDPKKSTIFFNAPRLVADKDWDWFKSGPAKALKVSYIRAASRQSVYGLAQYSAPIDRAAALARYLDPYAPSLAMALRKMFLVNVQSRECPELEVLSRAPSITDVEDPAVARQVREITGKLRFPNGLRPYPYQEVGIAYTVLAGYRAMIADQPGLGKTIQAIGVVATNPKKLTPTLVVCPASVMANWKETFDRWMPQLKTTIWHSSYTKRQPTPAPGTVTIVTWARVGSDLDALLGKYQMVIFDESHKAKNSRSKVGKNSVLLAKETPAVLLLTGTPLPNPRISSDDEGEQKVDPVDIWNQLQMIAPDQTPPLAEFRAMYGGSAANRAFSSDGYAPLKQRNVDAPVDVEVLAQDLRCFMIRRLVDDVGSERPKMLQSMIPVQLNKPLRSGYEEIEAEIVALACAANRDKTTELAARRALYLMRTEDLDRGTAIARATATVLLEDEFKPENAGMVIAELTRLREYTGLAKAAMMMPWISDFLDTGRGLVIFAYHKSVIAKVEELLKERGIGYGKITGGVSQRKRDEARRRFSEGRLPVIIISTAGGTGTDGLQYGASDILMLERLWVPAEEQQITARLDRTGQGVQVVAHYPYAVGTVDERMMELIDAKDEYVRRLMRSQTVDEGGAQLGEDRKAASLRNTAGKLILEALREKIAEGKELANQDACQTDEDLVDEALAELEAAGVKPTERDNPHPQRRALSGARRRRQKPSLGGSWNVMRYNPRRGGKGTPALPHERIKGSAKNRPGSAATSTGQIKLSESTIKGLERIRDEHNEKHPSKRVTLGQLKAVYRRGSGAFSKSHRPGMTRAQWSYGRVHSFLRRVRGVGGHPQDDDLI